MEGIKQPFQLQNPADPALPPGVIYYETLDLFLLNRLIPENEILSSITDKSLPSPIII